MKEHRETMKVYVDAPVFVLLLQVAVSDLTKAKRGSMRFLVI